MYIGIVHVKSIQSSEDVERRRDLRGITGDLLVDFGPSTPPVWHWWSRRGRKCWLNVHMFRKCWLNVHIFLYNSSASCVQYPNTAIHDEGRDKLRPSRYHWRLAWMETLTFYITIINWWWWRGPKCSLNVQIKYIFSASCLQYPNIHCNPWWR